MFLGPALHQPCTSPSPAPATTMARTKHMPQHRGYNFYGGKTVKMPIQKVPKKKKASSVNAIKEIKYYQRTTGLLIERRVFDRIVREITMLVASQSKRWSKEGLYAIQTAAEDHIVTYMKNAQLAAIHSDRVTITPRDIHMAGRMKTN
jgi:histone H3/H4